jgi:hypothetical protein
MLLRLDDGLLELVEPVSEHVQVARMYWLDQARHAASESNGPLWPERAPITDAHCELVHDQLAIHLVAAAAGHAPATAKIPISGKNSRRAVIPMSRTATRFVAPRGAQSRPRPPDR